MASRPTTSTNQNPLLINQGPLSTNQEPLLINGPLRSTNTNSGSPLQPNSRNNQQRQLNSQWSAPYRSNVRPPANPPVRAYNMPGISVRGPLLNQRIRQRVASFNNRGPLLGSAPTNNMVAAVPLVDPQDPPDMVNGVPITEAPEVPEPPDPTDPPEVPPASSGNVMPRQGPGGSLLPMILVEPTDPPDITDPPEYPMAVATPVPRNTIPPPTMETLLQPAPSTSAPVEQATPWPTMQNALSSPLRTPTTPIPTQPVMDSQGPVFQQAPPYIVTSPATAPPLTATPPTINRQSATNAVKQATGPSPLQITNLAPKPTPALTAAPNTGNRPSSWVMGANFQNMSPWRRMLWNRYFLNSA
ncbi:protein transport protein SEC31-like [Liolophura sinensis]|uniref:protein transport protein SEC31-like n=1 Tax=Liolophura sinensis TaxID=3198878 RepID=UPI00315810B5